MLRRYIMPSISLVLLLFGCAVHKDGHTDKPRIISEMRFPANSKLIIIPVTLKGKEYKFLLDTGSSRTAFDLSLKDQLGRRMTSTKGTAADGKKFDIEYHWLTHAHFGGLCTRNMAVAVMDLSNVVDIAETRVDGIVGMDILKDYIVQLDFKRNTVSFLKSKNSTGFPGAESDLSYKKKLFYMHGKVGDLPVNFLIDTGFKESYFGGLLESTVINKLKAAGYVQSDQARTIAGEMHFNDRKTIIANLSIGHNEYEDSIFIEHRESILGLSFFSRHVVTFDFPNKKVFVEKIADTDNSSEITLIVSGFDFTLIKHNNIIVETIDINGLAFKRGFRKGDVILKINNNDVSDYSLPKFINSLHSLAKEPNLERFIFVIKRDEKELSINILKN